MAISVKRPTLGHVELSFVSDRVVNCLSRQTQITPSERAGVFAKAAKFLDAALQGDEILKTGKLNVNASNQLRNFGWTAQAYAILASRYERPKSDDLVSSLKEFRDILSVLAEGQTVEDSKLEQVQDLFALMRDIALTVDTQSTDDIAIILPTLKRTE